MNALFKKALKVCIEKNKLEEVLPLGSSKVNLKRYEYHLIIKEIQSKGLFKEYCQMLSDRGM